MRHESESKVNNQVKDESLFPGAKANLTDLPTGTGRLQLAKYQMAKRLLNSDSEPGRKGHLYKCPKKINIWEHT
jgi:hypothetical protein